MFLDIPDSEYEQRRHASDLAAWVNRKHQEIDTGGQLSKQYFERRERNLKRLIEEAVPLSRLGLHLWTPGNEPHITLLPVTASVDAAVEVQGFSARSFEVEVTTIETEESTLRRQALAREGTVPLLGPIRREGHRIIAEGEMVDTAEEAERIIDLVMHRLRRKVDSGAYDESTEILVYLSQFWPLPPEERPQLRRRTEAYLHAALVKTSIVHYCFWPDYAVDTVRVTRSPGWRLRAQPARTRNIWRQVVRRQQPRGVLPAKLHRTKRRASPPLAESPLLGGDTCPFRGG